MTQDAKPTEKEIVIRIHNAFVELRSALAAADAPKKDLAPLDTAIVLYKGILATLEEGQT